MPMTSSPLLAALTLAKAGIPTFPCNNNKRPTTPHGFKDATTDPTTLTRLFAHPDATLIGMPTGRKTSLIAVDIDPKNGGDQWLKQQAPWIQPTRTHQTRSGGSHLIFAYPNQPIPNSAGRVAPGVDVRGDGGYIIIPPSPGYVITNHAPPAPLPDWLLHAALHKPPARPPFLNYLANPCINKTSAVTRRLARAYEAVARAPQGQRNTTLNQQTFALTIVAHEGLIPEAEVAELMLLAAKTAGLPHREAEATIRSAMRAAP